MLIKITFFSFVLFWLFRLMYRATGRYQVIKAPKSGYRELGREWETCFVGAYGKCAMFLKEELQRNPQSIKYKYKIKRLPNELIFPK